jgi:hypothetical protein
MADTFTALLRWVLQTDLGNINQWGTIWNSAVSDLVDEAVAGFVNIPISLGDVTLAPQNGLTDNQRPMHLRFTGSPGGTRTVTFPLLSKIYVVGNLTSPPSNIIYTTPGSIFPIELTADQTPTILYCDGINNQLHTLGHNDGIVGAFDWRQLPVQLVGDLGVTMFNAHYTRQGPYASIVIPVLSFLAIIPNTRILRTDDLGGLPAEIQYTAGPTVQFPVTIVDNKTTAIECYMTVPAGTGRDMQFFSADPTDVGSPGTVFTASQDFDVESDFMVQYSVN